MFKPAVYYRLDWNPEFKKLKPYLEGRGGVVQISYMSEDAAPDLFAHLLKEGYGKPGNGMWTSLRIYREWHTTSVLRLTVATLVHGFHRVCAARVVLG